MIAIIMMFTLWMRNPDTNRPLNEPATEIHKASLEITIPAAKSLINIAVNTLR